MVLLIICGAELLTVTLAEMFVAVDAVHVVAVAFSEQAMLSPFTALTVERRRVEEVPATIAPFLYQFQALAPVFSPSESVSLNVPGEQVAVEATYSGEEALGGVRPGRWSGNAWDAPVAWAE